MPVSKRACHARVPSRWSILLTLGNLTGDLGERSIAGQLSIADLASAPKVSRATAPARPQALGPFRWALGARAASHLPAGGEIVLFDRSWYNRAGVERVMGFCTEADVVELFRSVPEFERMLVRSGIVLIKYWFSITDEEQHLRFTMRIQDPLKQWKLSPMDVQARAGVGSNTPRPRKRCWIAPTL